MVSYVDTSALLKLYVVEIGSRWMSTNVRPGGIATSYLAVPEVGTSLTRLARNGDLTALEARRAWRNFRRDSRRFILQRLQPSSHLAAALLAARSPVLLRTLDAIHLQSASEVAVSAQRTGQPRPVFVSAELRLLRAAAAHGFATENPDEHP